jgi:hypothetical protein
MARSSVFSPSKVVIRKKADDEKRVKVHPLQASPSLNLATGKVLIPDYSGTGPEICSGQAVGPLTCDFIPRNAALLPLLAQVLAYGMVPSGLK